MDEVQAGVELPLAVLPQPPVLLQPRKAALNPPALGHHLEGMQLAPLGYLHADVSAQYVLHTLGKRLAYIAAVTQQGLHPAQSQSAAMQCLQGSFAVGHLGCGYCHGVWQPLGVRHNVALDARNILACVIALQSRCVLFLRSARPRSRTCLRRCAPVSRGPRQPDFFKACCSRLPPSRGSLQIAKYACTVRHFENSSGSMRHRQPLLSRCSTAQNTSYNSTLRGAVFLRAFQQWLDGLELLATYVARIVLSHYPNSSHHRGDFEQVLTAPSPVPARP